MAKNVKVKVDKEQFRQYVKKLRKCVAEYNDALVRFTNDLEALQTKGEGGSPVWNGTRAMAWYDKAIKTQNRSVKVLRSLDSTVSSAESYASSNSSYNAM